MLSKFRDTLYYELNNKNMNFKISEVINKITNRKKYIKGTLKYELYDDLIFHWFISIDKGTYDQLYLLDTTSNEFKSGKGYIINKNRFVRFIGEKGVTYHDKSLFRYKPGDIVKGTIINNIFYIK
jgi:hypothetical protein